jgi:NADPH:quinone reductase
MRAVLCRTLDGPDSLTLESLPDPVPGPGEAVVDMVAAALNFPDILAARGLYQIKQELPFVPGQEGAGVVSAVGEGVTKLRLGDRVLLTASGCFAEKTRVDARRLVRLPDSMDFRTAAGLTVTYGTTIHALRQRANLRPGETLLVLGAAGGVGLAAVELGKALGAKVVAAASSDEKLAVARLAGADELINYATASLRDGIKAATGGEGVDVVYDPVGGELTEPAIRSLKRNGRLLVIGFATGTIPKIPINLTLLKECSIVGVFWGSFAQNEPAMHIANMRELFELHAQRRIVPRVAERFPLEHFRAAYARLEQRQAMGKVILDIRPE